jgi:hypothetical protein
VCRLSTRCSDRVCARNQTGAGPLADVGVRQHLSSRSRLSYPPAPHAWASGSASSSAPSALVGGAHTAVVVDGTTVRFTDATVTANPDREEPPCMNC